MLYVMTAMNVTATSTANSIPLAFQATARTFADRIALKGEGGLGKSYTYAELADSVRRIAAGMLGPTFDEQIEIGLLSENRPEWPLTYLAITTAGRTVVPIDANLKEDEIRYIIENAGLKTVFCSDKYVEILNRIAPDIRVLSFDGSGDSGWRSIEAEPPVDDNFPNTEVAVLIYTSGTTGKPKAVELTHRNLLSNVEGAELALHFDENDIFMSVLPLHHTFEGTCGFLVPLTNGCSVVYARSLKSKDILEDIARNQCTVMCGVPLLFEKMYQGINRKLEQAPATKRVMFKVLYSLSAFGWKLGQKWGRSLFRSLRNKAGMASIRMFVSGGAALPPSIGRFFNLIGFDFIQGYGLTECSPVISANRPEDIEFGSVGPPLPNIEVKIHQPNAAGVGEIIARGDAVMKGYRNNPEKTAEMIKDGWLHTGDLGKLENGHLWITGRAKNLIVSAAGKNIYPEELEEKLVESRYILEAVVFGRKKENKQGEEVRAVIVPDLEQFAAEFGVSEENPDKARIQEVLRDEVGRLNNLIADYKRIQAWDFQLGELEKTSTKKVKRFVYK